MHEAHSPSGEEELLDSGSLFLHAEILASASEHGAAELKECGNAWFRLESRGMCATVLKSEGEQAHG